MYWEASQLLERSERQLVWAGYLEHMKEVSYVNKIIFRFLKEQVHLEG